MKLKLWAFLIIITLVTACAPPAYQTLWTEARSAAYYATQGKHEMQKGNYHEAIKLLRQALEVDPNSINARESLALAHHKLGNEYLEWERYSLASVQFEIALTINPNLSMAARGLNEANRRLQLSSLERQ